MAPPRRQQLTIGHEHLYYSRQCKVEFLDPGRGVPTLRDGQRFDRVQHHFSSYTRCRRRRHSRNRHFHSGYRNAFAKGHRPRHLIPFLHPSTVRACSTCVWEQAPLLTLTIFAAARPCPCDQLSRKQQRVRSWTFAPLLSLPPIPHAHLRRLLC